MKNKYLTKSIAMLVAFTTLNVFAHASYITDSVEIPLRSTNSIQSNPTNLIEMLPSDTELQLLSTDSGWSQVETANGTIGWMISQYLSTKKPAKVVLKEVQIKLKEELEANNCNKLIKFILKDQKQLIIDLITQNKKLKVVLESTTNKCTKFRTELEVL